MSEEDRTEYIDTLLYVQSGTDASLTAEYQALIQMHEDEFGNGPHWQTQFLPWHRWYILEFENILRKYTPCITVPFWAWELDAGSSYIWSNTFTMWGPESYALGSVTNPEGCVGDGPFSGSWTQTDGVTCLRRGQGGNIDDLADIQGNVLSRTPSNWNAFSNALEGAHDGVHCAIDGTMCTVRSAEAPEFFFHHVNIDRIWSLWQDQSNSHKYSQSGESNYNTAMTSVSNGETPADFTDLSNQYGGICAEYESLSSSSSGRRSLTTKEERIANTIFDVVDMLNNLPKEEEFWRKVRHTKEVTLDEARRFIMTKHTEEEADAILKRLGRTEYIENRLFDDHYEQKGDDYGGDLFSDISGITVDSVKTVLEDLQRPSILEAFTTEISNLELKYNDPQYCPAPYHGLIGDRCVWSCGVGTEPDHASYECQCKDGYVEMADLDDIGRRMCSEFDCSTDEIWSDEKQVWCCENESKGCERHCPAPYHVSINDRCVWSCGLGTTPDRESYECICKEGFELYGYDNFQRRLCKEYDCTSRELWTEEKQDWCCENENQGCCSTTTKLPFHGLEYIGMHESTPCIFPFTYDGITFESCTNYHEDNPYNYWCETDNAAGWGYCKQDNCPLEDSGDQYYDDTDWPTFEPTSSPTEEPTTTLVPTSFPTTPAPTVNPTECLAPYLESDCHDWDEILSASAITRDLPFRTCSDAVKYCGDAWVKLVCKCTCDNAIEIELISTKNERMKAHVNGDVVYLTRKVQRYWVPLPFTLERIYGNFAMRNVEGLDIVMDHRKWKYWLKCGKDGERSQCQKVRDGKFWWKGTYLITKHMYDFGRTP